MNRTEKKSHWKGHLNRWRQSGLTQKRYCEQNGISYWNFKTWAGRLKTKRALPGNALVRIDVDDCEARTAGHIEIRCGERVRLFVDGNIDPARLAHIAAALEKRHD